MAEQGSTFASGIYNSVSTIVNSVNNYYSSDNFEVLGQDKDILKIGNVLNSIFINRNDIEIPKLVVVGSQSSGKSSILNSIIGMDILPTGSDMVTRGPLQLELIQSQKELKAVFGEYIEGNWVNLNTINIDQQNPTQEQKAEITTNIKQLTRQYAGDGMNITESPIYLRIYSPNIPNLSLVDLPGLTMVACTDKGQPKDIKDRIRNLVGNYISNKESIILAVMPARTDIEADIALDLIKEHDPRGERSVGILTKVDLMNEGTDITHLLDNNVSKDLQLDLGYFGIRNRNKVESETISALEGLKAENEYFSKHVIYSNKKYKEKLGIPALCRNLSSILVKNLKKCFPLILEKINRELEKNINDLSKLGNPLPEGDAQKSEFLHKTIAKLIRSFVSIIDDRGKIINTGRNIKKHLIQFRESIGKLEPFSNTKCSDSYIEDAISNCEGNHMSFPSPPVEVLEQLIKDAGKKPLYQVYPHAEKCCQNIMKELSDLVETLLKENALDRFPSLHRLVITTSINDVFIPALQNTYSIIQNELNSQENYIWTEDKEFNKELSNSSTNSIDIMRKLADKYYSSTIYILQDTIPKKIMYYLVTNSQLVLSSRLYDKVVNTSISDLLTEVEDISKQRQLLEHNVNELTAAKQLIESIM
tara:strand:- start:2417 stop:4357 length:1941 start_codon:yes stop_codon:yes gene_type:complete